MLELEIATFDIHVILGNLFENAINAMANMTEPSFSVRVHYDRGVLCIRMENSCEEGERILHLRSESLKTTPNRTALAI